MSKRRQVATQLKISAVMVVAMIWSGTSLSANQVLNVQENTRLEANIAADMMNRLVVANDRIENVFGDEGTFVTQSDEKTGQVFIKPTPENGSKALSITLITENGLTQDLTLNPSASEATTLILKSSQNINHYKSPQEVLLPGFSAKSESQQAQWVHLMKQAVLGELPELAGKFTSPSRKAEGLEFKYEKSYQAGVLIVQLWSIKNTSHMPQELLEKNIYKNGDLALSLQKRILQPNEKACFYILGKL